MHQTASQKAAHSPSPLTRCDSFPPRHLGSGDAEISEMLSALGIASMDDLIARTVPAAILNTAPLNLPEALGESAAIEELRDIASRNRVFKSYLEQRLETPLRNLRLIRRVGRVPAGIFEDVPLDDRRHDAIARSEEHTSELQSL